MRNTIIILCFMSIVQYSSQQEFTKRICIGTVVIGGQTFTLNCPIGTAIENNVVGSTVRSTSSCPDSYGNRYRYCFANPPISSPDCHGKTECQLAVLITRTSETSSVCDTHLTVWFRCAPLEPIQNGPVYTPICNTVAFTPHQATVNYLRIEWDSSLSRCTTTITPPSGYKLKIHIDEITGVFFLCEMSYVVTIHRQSTTGCKSLSRLSKTLTKILDAPLEIDVDFSRQTFRRSKILFQISAVAPMAPAPQVPTAAPVPPTSTVHSTTTTMMKFQRPTFPENQENSSDRGRGKDNSSTVLIVIVSIVSTVAVIVGVVLIIYITRSKEKVYTVFAGLRNLRRQRRGNQRAERNVYSAAHTGLRAPTHVRRVPSVSLVEAGIRGRSIVSMRLPAPPPEQQGQPEQPERPEPPEPPEPPEQPDHETAILEMDNASQANNQDLESATAYYNMGFTNGEGLSDFDVPDGQAPAVPLSNTSSESSVYSLQDFTLLRPPFPRNTLPTDAESVVLPLPARQYSTDSDISIEPDTPIHNPTDENHFTTSDKSDQPNQMNTQQHDKENVEYTGIVINHNLPVHPASLLSSKQQEYLESDNDEEPVKSDAEDKKQESDNEQEDPVTYAIIDKERPASMKSKKHCDTNHLDPPGGDSETLNVCLSDNESNTSA